MNADILYTVYENNCNKLLIENDIRFAGIIDDKGNLISGGFKKKIIPLENNDSKLQSFMKFVSKISIRKDFDNSLGSINYLAARRDKVVLISFPFPVSKIILLVSANPSVDIEKLANKVTHIFSGLK